MKFPRRRFLHLAACAAALPLASRFALAQSYPARPVRILVGFAAGGNFDIVARLIGQWLSAMSLPKSADEPASVVAPRSARRAFILGSARPALISLLSFVDDFGRRVLGRTYAVPSAGLVARHEFAHGRQVRQRRRACRCCHRQGAKRARFDVLDRRRQGSNRTCTCPPSRSVMLATRRDKGHGGSRHRSSS